MAKNTTTIRTQAATCQPETVLRLIVGLVWPTRPETGGGALGGSLKEPRRADGALLEDLPRDGEGLRGAGTVAVERVTIGQVDAVEVHHPLRTGLPPPRTVRFNGHPRH